eukprot:11333178-Alexandrium_andersonii.AAC.1
MPGALAKYKPPPAALLAHDAPPGQDAARRGWERTAPATRSSQGADSQGPTRPQGPDPSRARTPSGQGTASAPQA